MEEELNFERYFNRYYFLAYACLLAGVIYAVEPQQTFFHLIVGALFMVVWTFIVGFLTVFCLLTIVRFVAGGSKIESFLLRNLLWLPHFVGFGAFITTLYY